MNFWEPKIGLYQTGTNLSNEHGNNAHFQNDDLCIHIYHSFYLDVDVRPKHEVNDPPSWICFFAWRPKQKQIVTKIEPNNVKCFCPTIAMTATKILPANLSSQEDRSRDLAKTYIPELALADPVRIQPVFA